MKENINIIFYKLLLSGTVIIFFFGSINQLISDNSIFKIDRLIISGCNLVKEESIEKQFSFIKDKNIFSLNIKDIKSKIKNNEFIDSANIIRVYPSTIILDLIEISPIGLLKINNINYLVDNNSNGFLCSANISNSIDIPELRSNSTLDMKNIFSSHEYKLLNHIYNSNQKLFNIIQSVSLKNNQIIVNSIKSKILFDKAHYLQQINHVSQFLEHTNNYNNFKYIKFSHLDVIVKDKDVI